MNNEKIIVFSNQRWGTTYLCSSILRYFSTKYTKHVQCNTEVFAYHNYFKSNLVTQVERILYELKQFHDIDINITHDISEINSRLLLLFKQDRFVYKYFQFYDSFFTIDDLASIDNNIRIIPLFRKNILDVIISRISVHYSNVWIINKNSRTKVDVNKIILDLPTVNNIISIIIKDYIIFFKNYNLLKSKRTIDNTVYYEDLTYDSQIDMFNIFSYESVTKYSISSTNGTHPVKIVNDSIRDHILNQFDVTLLSTLLTDSELSYDDDYNIIFKE